MLEDYHAGQLTPDHEDPFSHICLLPDLEELGGPLLEAVQPVSLESASGKTFYRFMVKTVNRNRLNGQTDTPWWRHLGLSPDVKPAWGSIYKPPLSRKHADLKWRILHGIVACSSFVSVLNAAVRDSCPFCHMRETVFHCFYDCQRLLTLFLFLKTVFTMCGENFNQQVFIFYFSYTRHQKEKCQFLNFVLGTSKMAIYMSRKRKVEEDRVIEPKMLIINMMKARLLIDFNFYKANNDLLSFQQLWCFNNILCSVKEGTLVFSDWLI